MLTFIIFNLKRTSLVTVLDKTRFLQKRTMQSRASMPRKTGINKTFFATPMQSSAHVISGTNIFGNSFQNNHPPRRSMATLLQLKKLQAKTNVSIMVENDPAKLAFLQKQDPLNPLKKNHLCVRDDITNVTKTVTHDKGTSGKHNVPPQDIASPGDLVSYTNKAGIKCGKMRVNFFFRDTFQGTHTRSISPERRMLNLMNARNCAKMVQLSRDKPKFYEESQIKLKAIAFDKSVPLKQRHLNLVEGFKQVFIDAKKIT